jgi:hypothetical protein
MSVADLGVVGNCQAALLRDALQEAVGATAGPIFYHSFDAEVTSGRRQDIARCRTLLVQDIKESDDYLERAGLPSHVKRLDFPCLRFSSLWPYDDFNGWRDSVARAQDEPDPDVYYDGALGRLRRQGVATGDRLDPYRKLAIPGLLDPRRIHAFEVRRLEDQDRRFGYTTGAMILEGFRASPLFYAVTRPNGALLRVLLGNVLQQLGLESGAATRLSIDLDQLRSVQVPVHPAVGQRLGVEWATEARLYPGKDGRERTWDTYVRDYVARYG